MTYIIQPYLHYIFQHSILPSVHLFVASNDKLVAGYCPFVKEAAYDAFKLDLHPWAIRWDGSQAYLITIMSGLKESFIKKVVWKITKDKTSHLTLVARSDELNCVMGLIGMMMTRRPYRFVAEGISFVACVLTGITGSYTWDGSFESTNDVMLASKREQVLASSFSTSQSGGFKVSLGKMHRVQGLNIYPWWHNWKDGLVDCELIQLDRARFERPARLTHFYDSKKTMKPDSPGLLRFLNAPALPDPHTDERSEEIVRTVIEPNKHLFEIRTQIDVSAFAAFCSNLPNVPHWKSYVYAFQYGGTPWVSNFPNDSADGVFAKNAPMSAKEWNFVLEMRDQEVAAGHWSPPFTERLPYMRTCPLAVAPKPGKAGYRLIQNASAPKGNSFNDHISKRDSKLKLDTVTELFCLMRHHYAQGEQLSLWVLDVKAFFRHFPLHPLIALRNCVMVEEEGVKRYYVDLRACFGGRSNPRYCSDWGDIVIAGLFFKDGITDARHYIDDFMGLSKWGKDERHPKSMAALMRRFDEMNVPYSKPQAGDEIHPLGLTVRYSTGEVKLQFAKVVKYLSAIRFVLFSNDGKVAFGDLEKLRGQLTWCLCVVNAGISRNRALHALLYKAINLRNKSFRLTLTEDAKMSLRWWDATLSAIPRRLIYEEVWWRIEDADSVWFTDASSKEGLGLYDVINRKAYYHNFAAGALPWNPGASKEVHINALELFAVLCAVHLVAEGITKRVRLVVFSDNYVTCCACASFDSNTMAAARLLRLLGLELDLGVDLRVIHVKGVANPADGPSRGLKGMQKALIDTDMKEVVEFTPSLDWLEGDNLFLKRSEEVA